MCRYYLLVVLGLVGLGFVSFCSDWRRVRLEKDVIRCDSFLRRIDCSLSNNSEEQSEVSSRIKKECEIPK